MTKSHPCTRCGLFTQCLGERPQFIFDGKFLMCRVCGRVYRDKSRKPVLRTEHVCDYVREYLPRKIAPPAVTELARTDGDYVEYAITTSHLCADPECAERLGKQMEKELEKHIAGMMAGTRQRVKVTVLQRGDDD